METSKSVRDMSTSGSHWHQLFEADKYQRSELTIIVDGAVAVEVEWDGTPHYVPAGPSDRSFHGINVPPGRAVNVRRVGETDATGINASIW